jgi:hypothetical protein
MARSHRLLRLDAVSLYFSLARSVGSPTCTRTHATRVPPCWLGMPLAPRCGPLPPQCRTLVRAHAHAHARTRAAPTGLAALPPLSCSLDRLATTIASAWPLYLRCQHHRHSCMPLHHVVTSLASRCRCRCCARLLRHRVAWPLSSCESWCCGRMSSCQTRTRTWSLHPSHCRPLPFSDRATPRSLSCHLE